MAKPAQTRVFKGKTIAEAMHKAKKSMGPNLIFVAKRHVSEKNLLSRLKLGGDNVAVELEVALEDSGPPKEEKKAAPAAPHPLMKSYAKAVEGAERHSPAAKLAMAAAAAPLASIGESASGLAGRLDEVKREVAETRRQNAELWEKVQTIVSLQARGALPAVRPELLERYGDLVKAGVSDAIARDIVEAAQGSLARGEREDAASALLAEVARRIPAGSPVLPAEGRTRVVALVGATGVGKSTSVVKLALHFAVKGGKSVGVINEDLRRPGAESQISNLTRMFGIAVASASRPEEIRELAKTMAGRDLVFVDTSGRSPRDRKGIRELAEAVRAAGAHETHLLLSSVTAERDMRSSIELFRPTGFDRVILTKLDECMSFGGIVNLGSDMTEGISYVTTGPEYTKPIEAAEPAALAELVLGIREVAVGADSDGAGG